MSEVLLEAIRNLEERIQELENRKPVVGPRGAPGSIDVALHALREEAPTLVENALRHLKCTTLRGETGLSGQDGARGPRGESATAPTKELIERLVQSAVIGALRDYQFLDTERGDCAGAMLRHIIEQEIRRLAVEK